MKVPAHWLLASGLLLAIFGCGDDDKGSEASGGKGGSSTTSGSGGRSSGSAAGSGGSTSTNNGSMMEGGFCDGDMDCAAGLRCVISATDDDTIATVCGRPCDFDSSCMKGETCKTITGKPADAHCWNDVTEPLKPCGPAETAGCAPPLVCLPDFAADSALGTCFNLCKLPMSMTGSASNVLDTCPDGQACVDLGVANVGVCGFAVARGAACSITGGMLCSTGDICISEVSNNMVVSSICFEECTKTNTCSDGKTCMPIDPTGMDTTKFCM